MIVMPQGRKALYSLRRKAHQFCSCKSCTDIPYNVLCRQGNMHSIHARLDSAHKANLRPSQLILNLEHSELQGIGLTPGRVPWCMRRAKSQYGLTCHKTSIADSAVPFSQTDNISGQSILHRSRLSSEIQLSL